MLMVQFIRSSQFLSLIFQSFPCAYIKPIVENSEPAAISLSFGVMAIVLLPFACGYFFSYFFRVVNAVVAPDLIAEIGLNAMQPGLLSAVCFLHVCRLFQIPDGSAPRSFWSTACAGDSLFYLMKPRLGVVRDNRLCQKRARVRNRARARAR